VGLLAALQFLTIAPPFVRRPFTPAELGRAVAYFPLVGLGIGGLLFALDCGLQKIWPLGVVVALDLSVWIVLTGALHWDGLLDTCDGLFGGHNAQERLRIMKDEHVGAFAVLGGIMLILVKYAALMASADRMQSLLLAPLLGRWGMSLAVVFCPYARAEGLGRAMKDHAGWREVFLATFLVFFAAAMMATEQSLLAIALAGIVTLVVAVFSLGRLPGLTGDIYGAICESVEAAVLLLFAAKDWT
jgi:adenosylcobinamide-GDP ribazoletransferase